MTTATNFIYDNIPLSSFDLSICEFGSTSSIENVSVGSPVSFNLASVPGADRRMVLGSSYQETLTARFQVGKLGCNNKPSAISNIELSHIMRWLNRKDGFHKFKLFQTGYENLYALANFNVNKIAICGVVYGLELSMTTLHPYLLEEQAELDVHIYDGNNTFDLYDCSDETGYIYPDFVITCLSSGDLNITNHFDDRTTIIKNCSDGEVITIDGENLIMKTSYQNHHIQNDFNFIFPRIANSYHTRLNQISVNLPCHIRAVWSPFRKVGF